MTRETDVVAQLEAAFAELSPPTIGLEEELLVLDPVTLDLLPEAARLADLVPSAVTELPAAQLELVGTPQDTVGAACAELLGARRALVDATAGTALVAAAGVHPFSVAEGELTRGARYDAIEREFGWAARRQLVFGLHVHVAVRPARRALTVFNGLRCFLPELAALGSNAPVYEGRDTGMASVRPKLSQLLPRQGVPPAFATLEDLARAQAWALRAGAMQDLGQWWWEARLHPRHGTIEVRVPDAQTTVAEAGAVAAVVQSLVVWLADRADAGEPLPHAEAFQVQQHGWSAARHGLHGTMAGLRSGTPEPTRERVLRLLEELGPTARRLECAEELRTAAELARRGSGADRQRAVLRDAGPAAVVRFLADAFLAEGAPWLAPARRSASAPAG